MRILRLVQVLVLCTLLVPAVATSAAAETVDVAMHDDFFEPESLSVALGDSVRWSNEGDDVHDSKSDETNPDGSGGVGWWSSTPVVPGITTSKEFTAAGTFPYHCTFHEGMTGTVSVPPEVNPRGVTGLGMPMSVRVATEEAPMDLVYDIQRRAPGVARWRDWRMGVTSAVANFEPRSPGRYEFRSRLRRVSTDGASPYSEPRSLEIIDHAEEVVIFWGKFIPDGSMVALGDGLVWTVQTGTHSSTNSELDPDSKDVKLWDSGILGVGQSFGFRFFAAGSFPYICAVHPRSMHATVSVPLEATPGSGSVGQAFRIRVASEKARRGLVYDIQRKDPGGEFVRWKVGVTQPEVQFRPEEPGTYRFRGRLRQPSTGDRSIYSPELTVEVTSASDGP